MNREQDISLFDETESCIIDQCSISTKQQTAFSYDTANKLTSM
jgi:hypothetical protein